MPEGAREDSEAHQLAHVLVRLGARKPIQEPLEREVTEPLGRRRYGRCQPGQEGAGSGYRPHRLC